MTDKLRKVISAERNKAILKERQRIVKIVGECVEFQKRKDPDIVLINKIDLLEAIDEL